MIKNENKCIIIHVYSLDCSIKLLHKTIKLIKTQTCAQISLLYKSYYAHMYIQKQNRNDAGRHSCSTQSTAAVTDFLQWCSNTVDQAKATLKTNSRAFKFYSSATWVERNLQTLMSLHPHAAQLNVVTGMREEHLYQLMLKKRRRKQEMDLNFGEMVGRCSCN